MMEQPKPSPESCRGLGLECEEQHFSEYTDEDRLAAEKEALGFYLSSHPLYAFSADIKRLRLSSLEECGEYSEGVTVRVALMVTGVKEHITKKGDKMAFCQAEDLTGSCEIIMFPERYREAKEWMEDDRPLLVTAKLGENEDAGGGQDNGEAGPRKVKLVAEKIEELADVVSNAGEPFPLQLGLEECQPERLAALAEVLGRYPGKAEVELYVTLPEATCRFTLDAKYCVTTGTDFRLALQGWREGTGG
jgi:DNA polymerase-3 subunit alpha